MVDEQKEKLIKEYEMALASQTACNLSGLVRSLSKAMELIWEEAREERKGVDYVDNHPIVQLYLEQMNFLCRADYLERYRICLEKFKKKD